MFTVCLACLFSTTQLLGLTSRECPYVIDIVFNSVNWDNGSGGEQNKKFTVNFFFFLKLSVKFFNFTVNFTLLLVNVESFVDSTNLAPTASLPYRG